jgi:hypothetical protein
MVRCVALYAVPNIRPVNVLRTPKEAYNPECLFPTVKHRGGAVMIWVAIPCYSAGPIITLHGRITGSDYVDISGNHLHPMVQMLRNNETIFQDASFPMHSQKCSVLV